MTEIEELQTACFGVARTTKWTQKPIDAAEITAVAERFFEIAKQRVWPNSGEGASGSIQAKRCSFSSQHRG
jgi:hypothetical protein